MLFLLSVYEQILRGFSSMELQCGYVLDQHLNLYIYFPIYYFDYVLLPDGTRSTNRLTEYKVSKNDNYMFKIKGETFKAGDKIADLSKVGLSQDARVSETDVKKNTYMIGAGAVKNDAGKRKDAGHTGKQSKKHFLSKYVS